MRILHTSDWHLGRRFHEVDLSESFEAWADWVVETVRREQIDVLVIAGDVYDRAFPPVASVRLLDSTLVRVVQAGASVVMTAGNHDSAARLGFGSRLLSAGGIYIGADIERIAEPVRLTGRDGVEAEFFLLPYLDTTTLATAPPSWLVREEGPLTDAGLHRAALEKVRDAADAAVPSVVVAHAFVAGGCESDSEREIRQGGIGAVPLSVFDGIDYTALGHLHRRQRLHERIRYSGSPLPFSFSEEGYAKGALIVDLAADGSLSVEELDFSEYRPVRRLRGTLAELLADESFQPWEDAYVAIELLDPERQVRPMEKLRERFPGALTLAYGALRTQEDTAYAERVGRETSPLEVAGRFFEFVRRRALSDLEQAAVTEAVETARSEEYTA